MSYQNSNNDDFGATGGNTFDNTMKNDTGFGQGGG